MGVKANVEHIDTNIIIRLITQDNPEEVARAEKLLSNKSKTYVLEDAAIMEIVFVLMGNLYRFSRQDVSRSIKTIMLLDNLYLNKGIISDALDVFTAHPKLSFVDCYLATVTSISGETPLWTLDKKLATQTNVSRLI